MYIYSIGKQRKWTDSSKRCYLRWGGQGESFLTWWHLGKDLKWGSKTGEHWDLSVQGRDVRAKVRRGDAARLRRNRSCVRPQWWSGWGVGRGLFDTNSLHRAPPHSKPSSVCRDWARYTGSLPPEAFLQPVTGTLWVQGQLLAAVAGGLRAERCAERRAARCSGMASFQACGGLAGSGRRRGLETSSGPAVRGSPCLPSGPPSNSSSRTLQPPPQEHASQTRRLKGGSRPPHRRLFPGESPDLQQTWLEQKVHRFCVEVLRCGWRHHSMSLAEPEAGVSSLQAHSPVSWPVQG